MTCALCGSQAHAVSTCPWRRPLRAAVLAGAALLAGCSSFNLGGVAYCPHGQVCTFSVQPPERQASQAEKGSP